MAVTIYLRSIIKDKRYCLAMFDSNGKGDINNLETRVDPDSSVVWKLDKPSGIKRIISISPRDPKYTEIFKNDVIAKSPDEFELQLPKSLVRALEAYNIEYVIEVEQIVKGEKVEKVEKTIVIDPYVRIEPPPVNNSTLINP